MDTDSLVDPYLRDGQKLVEELSVRGFDLAAAFWLKAIDDDRWYFYIVSPVVVVEGSNKGYGYLLPLVLAMPQPFSIKPLRIKMIGQSDPNAKDVLSILGRVNGSRLSPIQWGGISLGNVSIEGAYIYLLPAGTPG